MSSNLFLLSRCYRKSFGLTASQSLNVRSPLSTIIHARLNSTVPTPPPPLLADHARPNVQNNMFMIPAPEVVVGNSGCRYLIQRVLEERHWSRRVYLATAEKQMFILKDISQPQYYRKIYDRLGSSCPYVRLIHDIVPEPSMFVFKHFTGNLWDLVQNNLPIALTKRILKDMLRGLAALHDKNIVHTDVKPHNVVIEWKTNHDSIDIMQVQLTDLEEALYVLPKHHICGAPSGNWMWRSPEAHAGANQNTYSDMFSFGIVCIYAVSKEVIFAVSEDEVAEGSDKISYVLDRQMSYFASDGDEFEAFMNHIGDIPFREVFEILLGGFNETHPYEPVSLWEWEGIDADLKDLLQGLMNFDPAKRLTANEALAHKWFESI